MTAASRAVRHIVGSLLAPERTAAAATADPRPGTLALVLVLLLAVAGALTLPPVIGALDATWRDGAPAVAASRAAVRAGVLRLLLIERLTPPPTACVAAALVVVAADSVLSLARDRWRAVATVAILGLAPVLVERFADLVIAYAVRGSVPATPGEAVARASGFVTGPLLLWRGPHAAPAWLETLDGRCNLVLLWCVGLWASGLRLLDGRRLAPWHVGLPLVCLAGGGAVTWVAGPTVLGMILGVP